MQARQSTICKTMTENRSDRKKQDGDSGLAPAPDLTKSVKYFSSVRTRQVGAHTLTDYVEKDTTACTNHRSLQQISLRNRKSMQRIRPDQHLRIQLKKCAVLDGSCLTFQEADTRGEEPRREQQTDLIYTRETTQVSPVRVVQVECLRGLRNEG